MALMDITDAEKNVFLRRLLGEKRHIWFRVGEYKVILHGYGNDTEELPYTWAIEIHHPDLPNNRVCTFDNHKGESELYSDKSFAGAVSLGVAVIVELEQERKEAKQ